MYSLIWKKPTTEFRGKNCIGACETRERRAGVGTGAVEGSLGKERNESVEGKDRVHVPKWNAIIGSVHMQSAQLPQVTEFKYLGSTLQSDGGMSTEITKRTQCGWNNWRKMSGVLCDKRVPPYVKRKIHKMIVQPAMLYGMETVPVTSSHVKKLEVTEMKMGMRPHAKRPCDKRKHQGETEGREYCREVQESATQVVWPHKEARPRLRRKTNSGDGTTREKKARKTEAEMDGLCQPRHDSHRNAAATPQPSGSG